MTEEEKQKFMDKFENFYPQVIKIENRQEFKSYAQFDYQFEQQQKGNIFKNVVCIVDKNSGNYIAKEMQCIQEGCEALICINYQKETGYYTVTKCQLTHNHEISEDVPKKYYENRLTRGEEALALRLISKMGKDFEVISKEISRLTGKTIQVDDLNRILEEEELRKKRSVVHLYHLFLTTFKSN